MKKYKYRAVDAQDEVHTGTLEARNYDDFMAKIFKLRLYPIDVQLAGATDDKLDHLKKLKNKLEHRVEPAFETPEIETEPVKLNIDWYYVSIVALVFLLILASTQMNL